MQPEVVTAIIAGAASVLVAALTAYFTANRTISTRLTKIEVKVDLLWKTYVVDAVKASRSLGLIASQSREAPTDKWDDLLPVELRDQIDERIDKYSQYTHDPYDISIQVTKSMENELLQFSLQHNVRMKVIIGAIYVLAENVNES